MAYTKSAAALGIGALLYFEDVVGASPVVWKHVPEVKDIPELTESRDFAEVTNQDSTAFTKEYIAALIDAESVTFQANFLPNDAIQVRLKTMKDARDGGLRSWKLVFTGVSPNFVMTFNAMVAAWGPSFPLAEAAQLTFTLRRTGPSVVS